MTKLQNIAGIVAILVFLACFIYKLLEIEIPIILQTVAFFFAMLGTITFVAFTLKEEEEIE